MIVYIDYCGGVYILEDVDDLIFSGAEPEQSDR